MSGELYSYLVAATTDEAMEVVKAVEPEQHERYNQRTMTRMMRVLIECMYSKEVKVAELGTTILQLEGKWKRMMDEQPKETTILQMLKMVALIEM